MKVCDRMKTKTEISIEFDEIIIVRGRHGERFKSGVRAATA